MSTRQHTMKRTKIRLTLNLQVFSFIISTFSSLACAEAGILPKTAKFIPPETVVLMEVDNFSQLRQQFEKTNIYKLYKDPTMTAFIEDARTKWHEKIRQVDNNIGRAIIDADVLPQGRIALALVLDKQATDANELRALFIIQWGENISKVRELVKKQVEKAVEGGSHRKSEDYHNINIKTIITTDSSGPGHGFYPKLSYCFFDDCLIGSEDIELLKFAIAHIKGATSPTLADETDYTATMKTIGPYHDIDFYINIKRILKTITAGDIPGKSQTVLANLGFDNLSSIGCSLSIGRNGNSCCGKAFVKIEGSKKGICKMLETESVILKAPQFIPASVYSVTFLNLNIKKAYAELCSVLDSFSPGLAAVVNKPLLPSGPQGEPGVQLKTDIIDHLGSQMVTAQTIKKPFSQSAMSTEYLVALAANNPRALEKSMSLLHSKTTFSDKEARRELLGHTIYLINPLAVSPFFQPGMTPMQDPVPAAAQVPKFAFTVTDTHLIFGVESAVERAVRTLSTTQAVSLGSAKWFNSAKLAIPVGLACLEDNSASGELLWWMMKQGDQRRPLFPFRFGQHKILELFNFSLLPQFDAVRKYFGVSVFYGVSRPDGFLFEFKDIYPADKG